MLRALALLLATSATAQERGPVTNLPLPRYVSMKATEGNVRRGPSLSHRIDWVFKRQGMPLEITAEFGHWRRVRDRDGQGGWMHFALLSGARTVIVEHPVTLLARPKSGARDVARVEPGVIARIIECDTGWCRLNAGGRKGWATRDGLWGLYDGETVD